jgi:hypothetical protein
MCTQPVFSPFFPFNEEPTIQNDFSAENQIPYGNFEDVSQHVNSIYQQLFSEPTFNPLPPLRSHEVTTFSPSSR